MAGAGSPGPHLIKLDSMTNHASTSLILDARLLSCTLTSGFLGSDSFSHPRSLADECGKGASFCGVGIFAALPLRIPTISALHYYLLEQHERWHCEMAFLTRLEARLIDPGHFEHDVPSLAPQGRNDSAANRV